MHNDLIRDQSLSILNELLLPLRLAGVECTLTCYSSLAIIVTIARHRVCITIGDDIKQSIIRMCHAFVNGLGQNDELVMEYFQAYLKNSADAIACLLEEHNDSTTA